MPQRGMRSVTTPHDLGELLGVLVGEDALETLHQVARHAGVVRAGVVRVDHADARAPERVLVKRRFLWVESREAADVVAQNDVGGAPVGLRTELEERQELVPSISVQARGVVRELSDDLVRVGPGPRPHRRALFLYRQVLRRSGSAVGSRLFPFWNAKSKTLYCDCDTVMIG